MFAAAQSSVHATTQYCAVYGHPIKHSASPAMQNAGIAALGLNWRYLAFDVHPDNLCAAIAGAKAMRFIGLNLTVPHKILALDVVDELDESAKLWGSVNTIQFEGRRESSDWRPIYEFVGAELSSVRSRGFNTDADAIVRSLGEDIGCSVPGARVLLLGAGGAGRTAALRLAAEGAKQISIVNRSAGRAAEVAEEIRQRFPGTAVSIGYPSDRVNLMLNATSLGLKLDDPLPFDSARFALSNVSAVYDMIYRPAETKLLQAARAAGCRTANGIGMLLHQGAKALEIWSGKSAPISEMRQALVKEVYG